MIYGIFHSGSGLGNQLHRYVATVSRARELGVKFSMIAPENFKGSSFMDIFTGESNSIPYHIEFPAGKVVAETDMPLWEEKINYYNPEFNFVEDNTIIDGEFQDERYFEKHIQLVDKWLQVAPIEVPDDTCLIGFRGGEFTVFPELFLTKEYWDDACGRMKERGLTKFEVHTDDPTTARQFFPDYPIIHDIGINWRSMRYAKNAIIANSSFYIFPRLLSNGHTIAPRYWARRNTKEWSMPQNYYKSFQYI